MKRLVKLFIKSLPLLFVATGALAGETDYNPVGHYAWYAIAASIAIAIPAFGGAWGQGRAASAALEGIARNPGASGKIFVPMILGMALIESLVLFGLIMAFILSGKIA